MGFGSVNTPGASARERKLAEKALLARLESVEKTLNGSEKISGTSDPTAQMTATVGKVYINVNTGEEWKCVAVNDSGSVWEKETKKSVSLTASDVGAVDEKTKGKPEGVATLDSDGKVPKEQIPSMSIFEAGTSAPSDTKKLWIDTTPTTGGLKYHNGTEWVHMPVSTT